MPDKNSIAWSEDDEYTSDFIFDSNDPEEDETAEGLGIGEITIEDADSDY